jgi:O-antigen/teichoic acid export membrane protein
MGRAGDRHQLANGNGQKGYRRPVPRDPRITPRTDPRFTPYQQQSPSPRQYMRRPPAQNPIDRSSYSVHGYRDREDASSYAFRQWSGIAALLAIADAEPVLVPFSGAVRSHYTGPITSPRENVPPRSGEPSQSPGLLDRARQFAAADGMVRSALYMIVSYGASAGLGFAFWLIAARLFAPADVGTASSLISATTLIGFLGQFGLNTALIRYLPTASDRNRLITVGLTLVTACSLVIALVYILLTPLIAPHIAFIAHSLLLAFGFVILTASGGTNALTDSIFIAANKANYNAITDGLVGGFTKLIVIFVLAGAGSYGISGSYSIFTAATSGYLTAALVSLVLLARGLGWRPRFGGSAPLLKPLLAFSGANYIANVLNLLPSLVVPLIVLDRIGPSAAAYYYVAYQLASLLYQTVYAVESSFLAQGSHNKTIERSFLTRSIRILLVVCIPSFVIMLLIGHDVLSLFGTKYGSNAVGCFNILIMAVFPVAANNWLLTVLRLANRLKPIVVSNAIYAIVICGLAWLLASRGLTALALAWPIGVAAGGLVAGFSTLKVLRETRRPRRQYRN